MAVVRFLSKIILQLLELSLVLRQDERILIDRGDLLVDSGEGLLRACLLLAQFADELGAIGEPGQLAGDPCDPLLQTSLVPEGTERRLAIDVGPKRRNLVMQFVDAVFDRVAALFVLSLRELELPHRCACGGLPLRARGLRLLQPIEVLAQTVEILRVLLQQGPFGFELRGDLPLLPDLGDARFQRLEARRAVLEGGR